MIVRIAARVIVFLFCGASTLYAQTSQPALSAAWSWECKEGVEWAALAGRGQTQTILIATRDAHLQLLDPATGRPRLTEPLATGAGVRLVPGSVVADSCGDEAATAGVGPSDVAYCYDRHAACAIRLSDPPGLKWQYGRWPAAGEEFPGDPDTLTGWTLAQVAEAGLILVNSDGRVLLLSHADGSVQWQIELDRLRVARLHVQGSTAVVLWRAEGNVRAAFLRLDGERPEPVRRELGELWPVWSKLLSGGLLAVSPGEAVLYPNDGQPRRLDLPRFGSDTLAMDVVEPPVPAVPAANAAIRRGTLLVAGESGAPAAYDLSTAKRLWPKRAEVAEGQQVYALTVCGRHVVTTERWGSAAYDVASGAVLARCWCRDCPLQWSGSRLAGSFLEAVARTTSNTERRVILVRAELGTPAAREAEPARFVPRVFELESAGETQHVLWLDRRAVLIEPNGLRGYTLP